MNKNTNRNITKEVFITKVIFVLLGILLTLGGISLACTPIISFLSLGYFFAIMLLVYGIAGIIGGFVKKNFGTGFVFAIISTVTGIIMAIVPGTKLFADGILLNIVGFWFILQGIVTLVLSVKSKKNTASKRWIGGIIIGILGILVGFYSLLHPLLLAFTMGILLGCHFIISGINMVILAFQSPEKK